MADKITGIHDVSGTNESNTDFFNKMQNLQDFCTAGLAPLQARLAATYDRLDQALSRPAKECNCKCQEGQEICEPGTKGSRKSGRKTK